MLIHDTVVKLHVVVLLLNTDTFIITNYFASFYLINHIRN